MVIRAKFFDLEHWLSSYTKNKYFISVSNRIITEVQFPIQHGVNCIRMKNISNWFNIILLWRGTFGI